jgi:hypothetical protein
MPQFCLWHPVAGFGSLWRQSLGNCSHYKILQLQVRENKRGPEMVRFESPSPPGIKTKTLILFFAT